MAIVDTRVARANQLILEASRQIAFEAGALAVSDTVEDAEKAVNSIRESLVQASTSIEYLKKRI